MLDEIQVTLPSVGRIMYYYEVQPDQTKLPAPRAFLVCGVNVAGTLVSGCVFSSEGIPEDTQNIPVVQPHEEIPFGRYASFVRWMPYQVKVQQAKKEISNI